MNENTEKEKDDYKKEEIDDQDVEIQPFPTFNLLLIVFCCLAFYLYVLPNIYEILDRKKFLYSFEEKKLDLENEIASLRDDYQSESKRQEEKESKENETQENILPTKDKNSVRDLTNDIEAYVESTNTKNTKMKLNSLSFSEPSLSNDKTHAKMSVKVGLKANQRGLLQFLKFIEESGKIKNDKRIKQLLSISKLEIPVKPTSEGREINFDLELKAYFDKELILAKEREKKKKEEKEE